MWRVLLVNTNIFNFTVINNIFFLPKKFHLKYFVYMKFIGFSVDNNNHRLRDMYAVLISQNVIFQYCLTSIWQLFYVSDKITLIFKHYFFAFDLVERKFQNKNNETLALFFILCQWHFY